MSGKAPTVEDEMAKFTGFTAENGQTVKPGTENVRGAAVEISPEERQAGAKLVSEVNKVAPAAKVELTDAEADKALDKARAELGEGEELTSEEETEVLTKALADKKAASKPNSQLSVNDRVKRAQQGRRLAEAARAREARRADELEARLARLEAGEKVTPLTNKSAAGNNDAAKEPDPKDFELGELDPKYIRALVRFENAQADAERNQNQDKSRQKSDKDKAVAEATEKLSAFEDAGRDLYDDFDEVVSETRALPQSDPAYWPLSATLGKLMLDSEAGPHVAYVLASDPKEARRVNKLPEPKQIRWFFEQEAKFEPAEGENGKTGVDEADETSGRRIPDPSKSQVSRVTKAPAPPSRRNNGGGGNQQVSAATQDFAAFEALATNSARPRR